MNRSSKFALAAGALILLGTTAVTAWRAKDPSASRPAPTGEPQGVFSILHAQPFVLGQGYTHWYRKERPTVDAGYLLVLEVDPDFVAPRQLAEPVLYVGAETAERVNHGSPSGRAVVLVPAPRGADGLPALDLAHSPIYFGGARLPEEVDLASARAELALAQQAGLRPITPERIAAAFSAGGGLLQLADKTALERHAAELVLRLAPGEEELARNLLVPLSR